MKNISIILVLLAGCVVCPRAQQGPQYKINNIERIVFDEIYFVFAEDKATKVITRYGLVGNIKLIADVPIGEPMYVEAMSLRNIYYEDCIIHMHSATEINGK